MTDENNDIKNNKPRKKAKIKDVDFLDPLGFKSKIDSTISEQNVAGSSKSSFNKHAKSIKKESKKFIDPLEYLQDAEDVAKKDKLSQPVINAVMPANSSNITAKKDNDENKKEKKASKAQINIIDDSAKQNKNLFEKVADLSIEAHDTAKSNLENPVTKNIVEPKNNTKIKAEDDEILSSIKDINEKSDNLTQNVSVLNELPTANAMPTATVPIKPKSKDKNVSVSNSGFVGAEPPKPITSNIDAVDLSDHEIKKFHTSEFVQTDTSKHKLQRKKFSRNMRSKKNLIEDMPQNNNSKLKMILFITLGVLGILMLFLISLLYLHVM